MAILNNQEKLNIVDKIIDHFIKQGTYSLNEFGRCRYRGPNNIKCALGTLIEDSEYVSAIEGDGITTLKEFYPSKFAVEDDDFYNELQIIHDAAARARRNFTIMLNNYKEFRKNFE